MSWIFRSIDIKTNNNYTLKILGKNKFIKNWSAYYVQNNMYDVNLLFSSSPMYYKM